VDNNLSRLADRFILLAHNSGKWKKWLLPESNASDIEKALMAGHYVFSKAEFYDLKLEAEKTLKPKNINLDFYLKSEIKKSIGRYLKFFKLLGTT